MSDNLIALEKKLMLYDTIDFIRISQIKNIKTLFDEVPMELKVITLDSDYLFFDKLEETIKGDRLFKSVFLNLYFLLRDKPDFYKNEDQFTRETTHRNKLNFHKEEIHYINEIERVINYYNIKDELIQSEEFDIEGYLFRRIIFKSKFNKQEIYFRKDGSCYLIKKKTFTNDGQAELTHIYLMNNESRIIQEFEDELSFIHYCLKIIMNKSNSLLSVEQIDIYKKIEKLEGNNIFKVYYVNQTIENQTWFNEINPAILDGIIFSTDLEKEYAITKLGSRTNYFTLYPSIEKNPHIIDSLFYNESNSFAINDVNNDELYIEQILRAIRIGIDNNKLTSLNLNILSTEKWDKRIFNLIDTFNLKNHVKIVEQKSKEEMYKNSNFSIVLNSRNDEGLTILESLTYGCPVISFDSTFVSRHILTEKKNGFLIKENSLKQLAEVMSNVMLLSNEKIVEMKKNAYLYIMEHYKDNIYYKQWNNILENILKIRVKRNNVENIIATLLDCGWNEDRSFNVKVQIEFIGEMSSFGEPSINIILQNRTDSELNYLIANISKKDKQVYIAEGSANFDISNFTRGIWDLFVRVEYENSYFQKRVGHYKNEDIRNEMRKNLNNKRLITPYLTAKAENLSFKIDEEIMDKELLDSLKKEIKEARSYY